MKRIVIVLCGVFLSAFAQKDILITNKSKVALKVVELVDSRESTMTTIPIGANRQKLTIPDIATQLQVSFVTRPGNCSGKEIVEAVILSVPPKKSKLSLVVNGITHEASRKGSSCLPDASLK